MKLLVLLMVGLSLAGCVGDIVRGTVDTAAGIGTGVVDVATAPLP